MASRIALIQPIVGIGKALRIQKSPTGMQSIAAQLERAGHNVRMFHEEVKEPLLKEIREFNPDFAGISTMTANFLAGKELSRKIKEINPGITVVLGGWHASGCAVSYLNSHETFTLEEILNSNSCFDFIFVGEGELVILELIERVEQGKTLEDLKGIGYLDGEKIMVSRGERITDLDKLEFPSWNNLNIDKYRDLRTGELDLSVHAQRGCRFKCAYCATPDLYPGKPERFSPKGVVDYIQQLVERFNPSVITFTDEDFMAEMSWLEQLCDELIERKLNQKVKFDSFASTNDIIRASESGVLDKMKKANFGSYFVGIESLNTETIQKYERPCKKGIKIEEYMEETQKAIDLSNKAGLKFLGDYMIGAFWETEEQVREGFSRLTKLSGMPYVYLPILSPMPGTKLWKMAVDNDAIIKQKDGSIDWGRYDCSHQVTKTSYNAEELRDELEQEFYTSPQYQKDMTEAIKRNPDSREGFYLPFIKKLSIDHPKNEKLKEMTKLLE